MNIYNQHRVFVVTDDGRIIDSWEFNSTTQVEGNNWLDAAIGGFERHIVQHVVTFHPKIFSMAVKLEGQLERTKQYVKTKIAGLKFDLQGWRVLQFAKKFGVYVVLAAYIGHGAMKSDQQTEAQASIMPMPSPAVKEAVAETVQETDAVFDVVKKAVRKSPYTYVGNPTKIANTLLNHVEGFYPLPYWDNKQYSVGFGSYISYDDCKVLWKRAGLSEAKGKILAHVLHTAGWRVSQKIIAKYVGKPGTLTVAEAVEMRNAELRKFEAHIKEAYPTMPIHQRKILTMTVYNTGWAGFYGGFGYRKSDLAAAIERHGWNSKQAYQAYTRLKTTIRGKFSKGLLNRRIAERDAFFATVRKDSRLALQKKLEQIKA